MNPARLLYTLVCIFILSGLTYANFRGWVPVAVNATKAKHGITTNRFHK